MAANHRNLTNSGPSSVDENLSSMNNSGVWTDDPSYPTSESSIIFIHPTLKYLQLSVTIEDDEEEEVDMHGNLERSTDSATENVFTIEKNIADFISPYKFEFGLQAFKTTIASRLPDIDIRSKSETLHVSYSCRERSEDNLNLLVTNVGEILEELDREVSMVSEKLTGDASFIRYTRRHLDYFLAGSFRIKGYCDEDSVMHFVFKEDQRVKIDEHVKVIKKQDIRSIEIPDLTEVNIAVLELWANLTCRPSFITLNSDKVHIVGFCEDVNTDNLNIQKVLLEHTGDICKFGKSQSRLLHNKEVRNELGTAIEKVSGSARAIKWRVHHGRVEVAGRNKYIVKKTVECIQAFFTSFEISVNKRMLESERYKRMTLFLEANFSNKFSLTMKKEHAVIVTCINAIAEQVELIAKQCDVSARIIEPSELKTRLLMNMKDVLEQKSTDECLEITVESDDASKVVVYGTNEAHRKVEEVLKGMLMYTYYILQPDALEMLRRMENEPSDGLFLYKTAEMNITVEVKRGNIQDENVDVVVCSSPPSLKLGGAQRGTVAGSIHETRGPVREPFENENRVYEPGTMKVGLAGGRLKCKKIYHVVMGTYDSSAGGRTSKNMLRNVMDQCLTKAAEEGLHSIAFPAVGTGNRKYPCDVACDVMYDSIVKFAFKERNCTIRRVSIVLQNEQTCEVFNNCRRKRERDLKRGKRSWFVDTCHVMVNREEELKEFEKHALDLMKNQTDVKWVDGNASEAYSEETRM